MCAKRKFAIVDPFAASAKDGITAKFNTEAAAEKRLEKWVKDESDSFAGCFVLPIEEALRDYGPQRKSVAAFFPRVTAWFEAATPPVRLGMYQAQDNTIRCCCCWFDAVWDGTYWIARTADNVFRIRNDITRWRGLPKQPGEKQ